MLTLVWLAVVPAMLVTGWWKLVAFVSICSVYANAVGHWSAAEAAQVAKVQDEDADVQQVLREVRQLRQDLGWRDE